MRVTHVYRDSYPPLHGGIEQHIHTLVHQLKQYAEPMVLASGTHAGRVEDEGVPIWSAGALGRFQGAPLSPNLPYWIRRSRADVVHVHTPNPTGELAYLLAATRAPAVVTYHTDVVRQARAFRFYKPLFHLYLRRARRIIVATPQHISGSPILPAYREKCRVIPYGIDVDRFRATPAVQARASVLRRELGERLVLFVGKFRYYKGLEYLLKAFAQVDGRLILVGDGEQKAFLRRLAEELALGDRVVWLPHLEHSELAATMHACDLFVLPSSNRMEMFGLAMLEAQACGKPVVSTALGTGVEYVNRHEETGLVVPPRDAEALAAAITRLLDDPDYMAQLGQAAEVRARTLFRQEAMGLRTLNLYREVLAEAPALGSPLSALGRARRGLVARRDASHTSVSRAGSHGPRAGAQRP
jgi:rhamnosyl/mannosyltransferase